MVAEIETQNVSFYDRASVKTGVIPVGEGIPYGIERVANPSIGIGGVYGAWGKSYNNESLPAFLEERLGHPVPDNEILNLSELGFLSRHHTPLSLTGQEHAQVELEIGAIFLREAISACNWRPSEVDAVLIGMSAPISED